MALRKRPLLVISPRKPNNSCFQCGRPPANAEEVIVVEAESHPQMPAERQGFQSRPQLAALRNSPKSDEDQAKCLENFTLSHSEDGSKSHPTDGKVQSNPAVTQKQPFTRNVDQGQRTQPRRSRSDLGFLPPTRQDFPQDGLNIIETG
jgi:hypothetical protein